MHSTKSVVHLESVTSYGGVIVRLNIQTCMHSHHFKFAESLTFMPNFKQRSAAACKLLPTA